MQKLNAINCNAGRIANGARCMKNHRPCWRTCLQKISRLLKQIFENYSCQAIILGGTTTAAWSKAALNNKLPTTINKKTIHHAQ